MSDILKLTTEENIDTFLEEISSQEDQAFDTVSTAVYKTINKDIFPETTAVDQTNRLESNEVLDNHFCLEGDLVHRVISEMFSLKRENSEVSVDQMVLNNDFMENLINKVLQTICFNEDVSREIDKNLDSGEVLVREHKEGTLNLNVSPEELGFPNSKNQKVGVPNDTASTGTVEVKQKNNANHNPLVNTEFKYYVSTRNESGILEPNNGSLGKSFSDDHFGDFDEVPADDHGLSLLTVTTAIVKAISREISNKAQHDNNPEKLGQPRSLENEVVKARVERAFSNLKDSKISVDEIVLDDDFMKKLVTKVTEERSNDVTKMVQDGAPDKLQGGTVKGLVQIAHCEQVASNNKLDDEHIEYCLEKNVHSSLDLSTNLVAARAIGDNEITKTGGVSDVRNEYNQKIIVRAAETDPIVGDCKYHCPMGVFQDECFLLPNFTKTDASVELPAKTAVEVLKRE
jgi:hypothetical protein